ILMNAAYIRTLIPGHQPLQDDALRIESTWKSLYGENVDAKLADFPNDFKFVFTSLMDTPLPALKNRTLRALMPFMQADDGKIRSAANYIRTGLARPSLEPRHAVSAARMALTKAASEGSLTAALLDDIQKRTMELVR